MKTIIQNHCTLKVIKSKTKIVIHNVFHHKIILGSNIYARYLFAHILTECDTTFSIKGGGKATVFKKNFKK